MKRPWRPRDPAQRAKLIVDIATGEVPNDSPAQPEARRAEAGRKGGRKGGKARAERLSPRKRKEIARRAAAARWQRAR